jgi:hypothetical protein
MQIYNTIIGKEGRDSFIHSFVRSCIDFDSIRSGSSTVCEERKALVEKHTNAEHLLVRSVTVQTSKKNDDESESDQRQHYM